MQQIKQATLLPKYEFHGVLSFTYNWNKKLYCKFFTTIRLANTAKYHVGRFYKVILKENYAFDAKLHDIRYCKIDELPEFTCYQDTGYNKEETINTLKKMYTHKNIDWSTQLVSVLLLENMDWEKPE